MYTLGERAYHVESDDIFEGDLARAVPLHEDLVDDFWRASGRKTDHEGLVLCRFEALDSAYSLDVFSITSRVDILMR